MTDMEDAERKSPPVPQKRKTQIPAILAMPGPGLKNIDFSFYSIGRKESGLQDTEPPVLSPV
jgi:hypothetical protein